MLSSTYNPWILILKLTELTSYEKHSVPSLAFLADNIKASCLKMICFLLTFHCTKDLKHNMQKWMNHNAQEWIAPYAVESSWFQNKDTSLANVVRWFDMVQPGSVSERYWILLHMICIMNFIPMLSTKFIVLHFKKQHSQMKCFAHA